jgi:adenylate cyclase
MAEPSEAFKRALEQERQRNARSIAAFRFYAGLAVFAVNLLFDLTRPLYVGPPPLVGAVYIAVAAVLWWGHGRIPRLARWSALSIAFVDMPFVVAVIVPLMHRLHEVGYPTDAAAVSTQVGLFNVALILAASLSLEERYTWMSAGVALALQTFVFVQDGRDVSFIATVAVATLMVTYLALYSHRRSVALVRSAADEQARRERLGRYFSPQVAEALLDGERVPGAGSRHDVTVLFADIRDFTARAQTQSSEAVVRLLNDYHSRMVDCVFRRGGTLDKYLGDGLMAYFGAPVEQADHAERAVRCALDMQQALAAMNADLASRREPPLRMGIGIHTGSVILGDIGADRRREFTIIGDTVNVAARVEQLTKVVGADILATEETRGGVRTANVHFAAVEPLSVKGKREPLQTYRVELR